MSVQRSAACAPWAGLLTTALLLALAPAPATANHTATACGKKRAEKLLDLGPAQKEWIAQRRVAVLDADLDGDGQKDHLELASNPSFRHCDPDAHWYEKETVVRIDWGHGGTQVFHWISDHLVEGLQIYPGSGRFLARGVDYQGNPGSRWVVLDGDPAAALPRDPDTVPGATPVAGPAPAAPASRATLAAAATEAVRP